MTHKGLVLITDYCDPLLIEGLQQLGYTVHYHPDSTQQQVEEKLPDYTGIVIATKTVLQRPQLEKAVKLKFIARAGSGMDHVAVDYAGQKNIRCINSPEGNRNSVAEHAVGMLLSLYHHIPKAFNEIKNGQWNMEANRPHELEGSTIGIIGYGNMGSGFAEKLRSFNVTVLAYDKYKKNYTDAFAKESSMEEIYIKADVVSLHLPLTPETHYLVNEDFISHFQKPFYLLNLSRGKIVNTLALIDALKKKKILGAGIDVLENENVSAYSPSEKAMLAELIGAGEVVITPHIAGKSFYTRRKFAEALLDKIKNL